MLFENTDNFSELQSQLNIQVSADETRFVQGGQSMFEFVKQSVIFRAYYHFIMSCIGLRYTRNSQICWKQSEVDVVMPLSKAQINGKAVTQGIKLASGFASTDSEIGIVASIFRTPELKKDEDGPSLLLRGQECNIKYWTLREFEYICNRLLKAILNRAEFRVPQFDSTTLVQYKFTLNVQLTEFVLGKAKILSLESNIPNKCTQPAELIKMPLINGINLLTPDGQLHFHFKVQVVDVNQYYKINPFVSPIAGIYGRIKTQQSDVLVQQVTICVA
eukprot:403339493